MKCWERVLLYLLYLLHVTHQLAIHTYDRLNKAMRFLEVLFKEYFWSGPYQPSWIYCCFQGRGMAARETEMESAFCRALLMSQVIPKCFVKQWAQYRDSSGTVTTDSPAALINSSLPSLDVQGHLRASHCTWSQQIKEQRMLSQGKGKRGTPWHVLQCLRAALGSLNKTKISSWVR